MQVVFAKDVIVTKQSWMDSMLVNMSAYACVPTGYFRSCYEITEDECFDKAIDVTQSCLNKLGPHIPMTLTQPRDGKYYGSMVGECFGTSFTSPYIKKKRYAPQPCNDPSNWK
jgi:hypothetical protein